MLDYLKRRWAERSTKLGLAVVAVTLAKVIFPEYSMFIDMAAGALGLTAAAVPDKQSVIPGQNKFS